MKKAAALLFALLSSTALLLNPDDAHAKRLGGGKSFGGRPSYSQPYRPAPDASPAFRPSQPNSARLPAAQQNEVLRQNFRSRGGLMGMLGGLALGGLLGAMLFGGGFEHINLFDIAILGLAAYLLFRLFAARRGSAWEPALSSSSSGSRDSDVRDRVIGPGGGAARTGARFDTNVMFRGGDPSALVSTARLELPPDFDQAAFLERAKRAFAHLQKAWDEGDFDELRSLTTPAVYQELMRQYDEAVARRLPTDILSLDAQIVDYSKDGSLDVVSVLFRSKMREDGGQEALDVREVWHFVRDRETGRPTWYLDGVQQTDG
jgi:predicted lipid-binding transport protein (Tim44 family)